MRLVRQAGAAIVCAALASTGACSTGTSNGTSHPDGNVAARQQAALAYAKDLAGRAPRIPGEMPLTTAPQKNLQQVDETIGVSNLVVRARYWNAGHLLGSASIELEFANQSTSSQSLRLLASGDIGPDTKLLPPKPVAPPRFE